MLQFSFQTVTIHDLLYLLDVLIKRLPSNEGQFSPLFMPQIFNFKILILQLRQTCRVYESKHLKFKEWGLIL